MNHTHAKWSLRAGSAAILVAIILGWAVPWDTIAPGWVIIATFVLFGAGAVSALIGLVYYVAHPVRRNA